MALSALSKQISASFDRLDVEISIKAFCGVESLLNGKGYDSFDVFFLDIDMPGTDGLDFGSFLRANGSGADIVFISNREERVYESLKIAPLRFIRKSKFYEEIDEAARALKARLEQRGEKNLICVAHGQVCSFVIDEITYVECFGKTQSIVTDTQSRTIRATMGWLEEKLRGHGFINPHKGYLVNYRCIDSIEKDGVILQNGKKIPISKYKLAESKKTFMRLVSTEPVISAPRLYKP